MHLSTEEFEVGATERHRRHLYTYVLGRQWFAGNSLETMLVWPRHDQRQVAAHGPTLIA